MPSLEKLISELNEMDRPTCLKRWREVFGRSPPKSLSLKFMKRVLIWELQTRVLGGISNQTDRQLKRIASGRTIPAFAKPGSHLVREWNGRTYQVEVVEGGYVMDGKIWKSLTALAKHITGAHWSGPRFFGLT